MQFVLGATVFFAGVLVGSTLVRITFNDVLNNKE